MNMKMTSLDLKDNVTRYKAINAAIVSVGAVLLIGFAVMVYMIITTTQEIADTRTELDKVRGEISYFNLAKLLAADEVEGFNDTLLDLIPEQEDYFSIIASLERLSARTGLRITRYAIDLPEGGSDKFTLNIVGTILPSQLDRFLNNYKYGTGRLVTIESMALNPQEENNVRVTMNFYSRAVTTSTLIRVGTLDRNDIQLMSQIREAMAVGEESANEVQEEIRIEEERRRLAEEEKKRRLEEENRKLTPTQRPSPTPRR
jgi:hypothetical protein